MDKVMLIRDPSTKEGTPGTLILPDGWECFTLECPWKDNQVRRSCIPVGEYNCSLVQSPKFGKVYGVHNVPGRSAILIHAGNVAGDIEQGLRSDVEGCIMPGMARGTLYGQRAVLSSRVALTEFMRRMGGDPFNLEVLWASSMP